MKKILITGTNSYIGNSFADYLCEHFLGQYTIDKISLRDSAWREKSFAGYDTVFHVAGIAHSDSGRISPEKEKLYYGINTDLTIEVAEKAKIDGVKQFIFMSSAIVYGESAPIGKTRHITRDTPVAPTNCYGDSKVLAEKGISLLNDEEFKVVILRPPMIYGKESKGNYPLLSMIAQSIRFFPKVKNERSMLYIGNLVEFVRLMIENYESGLFWPQNAEYSNTSELVSMIAKNHGKKVLLVPGLTWLMKLCGLFIPAVNKAFGSLSYDMEMSKYGQFTPISLDDSITLTEQ